MTPEQEFRKQLDAAMEETIGSLTERQAYEIAVEWGREQEMFLRDLGDDQ